MVNTGWKRITTLKSWGSVKLPLMLALYLFIEVPCVQLSSQKPKELPCLLQLVSTLWLLFFFQIQTSSVIHHCFIQVSLCRSYSTAFMAVFSMTCVFRSFFNIVHCDGLLPPLPVWMLAKKNSRWPQIFTCAGATPFWSVVLTHLCFCSYYMQV